MDNLEKYWRVYYDTKIPESRQQLLERSAEVVKVYLGRLRMFTGFNLSQGTLDELGVQGLMRAVDTYEWCKNISFDSYVKVCVKREIKLNYLPKVLLGDKADLAASFTLTLWLDSDNMLPENGDVRLKLASVLGQLSEQESLILQLFYYEELTLVEISQVTGLTEDTILGMFSRTLYKLKNELAYCMQLLLV